MPISIFNFYFPYVCLFEDFDLEIRGLRFADKERELAEAQAEIRALRLSERLREKAVEEVNFCFNFFFLN